MIPDSELDAPLASSGRRTHPLSGLVLGLVWGFYVAAAFGLGSLQNEQWIAAVFLIPIGFILGVAGGYLRWYFTHYIINGTEVRIETGPIFRSSRRIPFTRLQSVDINQPFVARIFGLAELTIEMAGGSESMSRLRFLPLKEAKELRALILDKSHERENRALALEEEVHDERSLITRVGPDRLLLGALLSLELWGSLLVALTMLIALLVFESSWLAILGALPAVGIIFQVVSNRVVAQWDFTLTRGARGLRIKRGLFSRSSQTIPFDRIQGVSIKEPIIWRRYGWAHVEVDVAGYGITPSDDGVSNSTLLPIADRALVDALVQELIPDNDADSWQRERVTSRSRLFAPIGWRYRCLTRSADTVRSNSGWLTRTTEIIPQSKVQTVSISQGPLQRRRNVATVSVHTPDGPVEVEGRHLNAEDVVGIAINELALARNAKVATKKRTISQAREGTLAGQHATATAIVEPFESGHRESGHLASEPVATESAATDVEFGPSIEGDR